MAQPTVQTIIADPMGERSLMSAGNVQHIKRDPADVTVAEALHHVGAWFTPTIEPLYRHDGSRVPASQLVVGDNRILGVTNTTRSVADHRVIGTIAERLALPFDSAHVMTGKNGLGMDIIVNLLLPQADLEIVPGDRARATLTLRFSYGHMGQGSSLIATIHRYRIFCLNQLPKLFGRHGDLTVRLIHRGNVAAKFADALPELIANATAESIRAEQVVKAMARKTFDSGDFYQWFRECAGTDENGNLTRANQRVYGDLRSKWFSGIANGPQHGMSAIRAFHAVTEYETYHSSRKDPIAAQRQRLERIYSKGMPMASHFVEWVSA